MIFFIILIIVLIILFVKFKLKVIAKFKNNNFELYIYNFKIFPKIKKNKKKNTMYIYNNNSSNNFKNTQKKKSRLNLSKKFSIKIINLINGLINNKFKPTLIVDIKGTYSIEDAAINAEIFGLINILLYFLVDLLNLFIETIPIFKITPQFENRNRFDANISCIIKINLAQIIFILILVIKNLTYKGEKINGK